MILQKISRFTNECFSTLEQKTRIGIRPFLKGWSWLFSGQISGSFAALLLAIGYAHFLPQDVYGTFKYILSILGILTIFSLPGMGDASQRAIARKKDALFIQTFLKRIQWGAVGALISVGIALYYFTQGNMILASAFAAASPFLIFLDTLTHFQSLLMGRQLFKEASIIGALIQIVSSLAIFTAVYLSNDVLVILLSYLVTFVILRGAAFLFVTFRHTRNNESDRESVRYGKHISIINVMGMSAGHIDSVLLWHFLGATPLAIYAFAQAGADQMRKMFKLVTTSMAFPKFSGQDKNLIKQTLPRKVGIAFLITIPLAIMLAALIPYLYTFLFPQYVASIPYAQVLVLMLALSPLRFFSTAINAVAPISSIYILSAVGSILRTLFLLITIPFFGIWGAVLSLFLQQLVSDAAAVYLFKKM